MPWTETSPMTERQRFIDEALRGETSLSELCRRFGISRKTGHKWVRRYLEGCELTDRSRRPHTSPRAVRAWLEDAIVEARRQRPRWGPRKVRAALLRANPGAVLPSVSTFAVIFTRNGLVRPRRRRHRTPPFSAPFGAISAPNALWCVDFKGQFLVGRTRCYPLTVMDAFSRYLLACVALRRPDGEAVRRAFEAIFAAFGLPAAIRTDNGPPFATAGPGGLSRLAAWWLKLGIRHERIAPGHPEQNGRHERMHLTLKQATAMPPATTLRAQQRAFDRFRAEYNQERPHEALGDQVPAACYEPSPRALPAPPWGRDLAYPPEFETVRVRKDGRVAWNGRSVLLSAALRHERVGLEWGGDTGWAVWFGPLRLGWLTTTGRHLCFVRARTVTPAPEVLPMSVDELSPMSPE